MKKANIVSEKIIEVPEVFYYENLSCRFNNAVELFEKGDSFIHISDFVSRKYHEQIIN